VEIPSKRLPFGWILYTLFASVVNQILAFLRSAARLWTAFCHGAAVALLVAVAVAGFFEMESVLMELKRLEGHRGHVVDRPEGMLCLRFPDETC